MTSAYYERTKCNIIYIDPEGGWDDSGQFGRSLRERGEAEASLGGK